MFRDAYRRRRCIMPVDLFFEWKAIKGAKAKQPYAIGMRDGSAFGLAGLWENWKDPTTDEWIRTFAVLTTEANELVAEIHDRMPVILRPEDFDRALSVDPDHPGTAAPVPGRADAHVADLHARELAEERRCGPAHARASGQQRQP